MTAEREAFQELGMKEPPRAGHKEARAWIAAGFIVYLVMGLVFFFGSVGVMGGGEDVTLAQPAESVSTAKELDSAGTAITQKESTWDNAVALLGLGEHKNYTIFLLILSGIAVWVITLFIVHSELNQIKREEEDIQWLFAHKKEGLPYVTVPHHRRSAMMGAGEEPEEEAHQIETLVDERVRRMRKAAREGTVGVLSVEEMRIHAEQNTARYGSLARYASTLLLLLAVLGTFAGVKTALPGLIDAIANNSQAIQSGTASAISTPADLSIPLEKVSEAFGGNALALIGAISVGIMAQGLSRGRRNLLERLEVVSAEYIYTSRFTQTSNPMENAVHALRGAVDELKGSTGAMVAMRGRMDTLAQDFQDGFDNLGDQLHDILERHETGLYDRTSRTLDDLQRRVAELVTVVDDNARIYGGIVDRVGERSAETREAIQVMNSSNESLSKALDGMTQLGKVADELEESVQKTIEELRESSDEIEKEWRAVSKGVDSLVPAINTLNDTAARMTTDLEENQQQVVQVWEETGKQIATDIESILERFASSVQRPSENSRQIELLERISRDISRMQPVRADIQSSNDDNGWSVVLTAISITVAGGGIALLLLWLL